MNDSSGHYKFEVDFDQVRDIPEDPKERLRCHHYAGICLAKMGEYEKRSSRFGELSDEYLSSIEIKINQIKQIFAEKLDSEPIIITPMPDNSEVINYLRNGILK